MKIAQKRMMTCLLVAFLAISLTACGRIKTATDTSTGGKKAENGEAEENKEEEAAKELENADLPEKDDALTETDEKKEISDYPTLGQEDIQDYDGFTYLYCELLRTESKKNEETGKMESYELPVFIPLDETAYIDRSIVLGEMLGIEFQVSLEPYLRYDAEDGLVTENLDDYLEAEFDPYLEADRYKDTVIGKAQKAGENAALATVEYLHYNKYDDTYTPIFGTYYLEELKNGEDVLVAIKVNATDITEKTPELIGELETFYPFAIYWDKDKAAKKLEDFLANGGENSFTTGYLLFELPDEWGEDEENSDFENWVYAPDGDVDAAQCFVSILRKYVGYGYAEEAGILKDESLLVEAVKIMVEEENVDAEVSFYGDTCLGKTAVAKTMVSTENGEKAEMKMYIAFDDGNMYMIISSQTSGAVADADAVAQDILASGQVRE